MKNHKAAGPNKIRAEAIKYGKTALAQEYTEIFNNIFETRTTLTDLHKAHLIALNKSKTKLTPKDTRPITPVSYTHLTLPTIYSV